MLFRSANSSCERPFAVRTKRTLVPNNCCRKRGFVARLSTTCLRRGALGELEPAFGFLDVDEAAFTRRMVESR